MGEIGKRRTDQRVFPLPDRVDDPLRLGFLFRMCAACGIVIRCEVVDFPRRQNRHVIPDQRCDPVPAKMTARAAEEDFVLVRTVYAVQTAQSAANRSGDFTILCSSSFFRQGTPHIQCNLYSCGIGQRE